ncbi:MAG: hypothetical protein KQH59_10275 [Desulfobulbaceae bacterium]|nr:hypothetical protein [Desulfobulbaceae bacterium]
MKIIIGIYQNQDDADELYRRRAADRSAVTETGPFFSKNQALSWMDYLTARIAECEVVATPDERTDGGPWYGFTIEVEELPLRRQAGVR